MQISKPKENFLQDLSSVEKNLEQRVDVDLKQLWEAAKLKFEKDTNYKLNIESGGLEVRINEQIERLLSVEDPPNDEGSDEGYGLLDPAHLKKGFARAKKLFKNVFKVLWKFSGFVIPAASTIPIIGSGVSFLAQAIGILIDTTAAYRQIFIKAAELFEQVGFFSMRFEMLMEAENAGAKVHPKFIQFLNVILIHTLECVALYIKIANDATPKDLSKRERMKYAGRVTTQFFKTMTLDHDAGVEAHLSKLRSLVEEEHKLSSALVLSTVLQIHTDVIAVRGGVSTISKGLEMMSSRLQEQSNLLGPSKADQLKKMLNITEELWASRLLSYSERRIEGTGEWLLQHELLLAWISNLEKNRQVLALEAGSSSGKTYLAIAAIAYLRKCAKEGQISANVALYLFDTASKKLTFGDIVRAIAYQLYIQDLRFYECAFPIVQKMSEGSETINSVDLWKQMIVEIASKITGSTCYIILDGLNLMDERELVNLGEALAMSSAAAQSLRILITGDAASLATITRRYSESLCSISLAQSYLNHSDVALVANAYLEDCRIFLEEDSTTSREYRTQVCDRLVQLTSGDYYVLLSRIGDIRRVLTRDEMETVLNRSHERRQDAIAHNLSNLMVRLSQREVLQLRETLQLMSVLNHLGIATAQLSVVQRYLANLGTESTLTKQKVESAYSNLLVIDDRQHLALAVDDIASYIMPIRTDSESDHKLSQSSRKGQLKAIQQLLTATFTPETLATHGFDGDFFNAKLKFLDINQFTIDFDTAMANTVIHLIDSLTDNPTPSFEHNNQHADDIAALARDVIPAILIQHDLNTLDELVAINLGASLARLLFADNLLEIFLPVEALPEVQKTLGADSRFYDAVYRFVKKPGTIERLQSGSQGQTRFKIVRNMSSANEIKVIVDKMIAKRWLQSNSFWTYEDIRCMLLWFSTSPDLGLKKENLDSNDYDKFRTRGWYTPANWEKVRTWAVEALPIVDEAELEIQAAAVLCAFGNNNGAAKDLVQKHRNRDWRAVLWLAEATSLRPSEPPERASEDALGFAEECVDLIASQKPNGETLKKGVDCVLDLMGHWGNVPRNMDLRLKLIALYNDIPGILSYVMMSFSIEIEIRLKHNAGFEFFQSMYETKKEFIVNTFIHRGSSNNFMHIALGRALVRDADNSRVEVLSDAYRHAMAGCRSVETLSSQQAHVAKLKLGFWYGRIHFLRSNMDVAIEIWEDLLEGFLRNPAVADVEIVLPIATHLCSAYMRKVLQDTTSPEAGSIMIKLTHMYTVANFSQDPLTLKLRFRLGLCLARLHTCRDETTKAKEVMREHAISAFAMIDQANNLPLASIGWFYLASILTMLSHNYAVWVWSGLQVHQPDRWSSSCKYNQYSSLGENSPLEVDQRIKLDAIKRGEEHMFYDGNHTDNLGVVCPDDLYLPTYASMACEGRQCWSTSDDRSQAYDTYCRPLQVPAEWPHCGGGFTPAQEQMRKKRLGEIFGRVAYWVCKDCMLAKLCVTCSGSLERGELTPMGCDMSHDGVMVPAYDRRDYPCPMTEEDHNAVEKLRTYLIGDLDEEISR